MARDGAPAGRSARPCWCGRCSRSPKARLIATLDARRHRTRRRPLEPRPALHPRATARGDVSARPRGLDARRLSLLARRLRRAEAAIETAVDVAMAALSEAAVAGSRADRVRCRPLQPPARGGRPAAARPRDCTHSATRDRSQLGKLETLYERRCRMRKRRQARAGGVPWRERWSPAAEPSLAVERASGRRGQAAKGAARAGLEAGQGRRAPPPEGRRGRQKGTVKGIELVPLAGAPRHLDWRCRP